MKFNINYYTRLKQIAFFIPNIEENDNITTVELYDINTPDLSDRIDDVETRERINRKLYAVFSRDRSNFYPQCHYLMKINRFEMNLFSVCLRIYNNLSSLFSPYHENYCFRKEQGKETYIPLENHSDEFYKTIPKDAISRKTIREKSFKMFLSLKEASRFFCEFTPSYLLYKNSETINIYEESIPFLTQVKEHLAYYFCGCPVEPYFQICDFLSDLSESLKIYSICYNTLNDSVKDKYWLEMLYKGIIVNSFDIIQLLSPDVGLSFIQRLKASDSDNELNELEDQKKTNWKNNIKKAKQLSHAKRQEFVEGIKASIEFLKNSEHISARKACDRILKDNKGKLEEIGITSSRTLENQMCPNGDPNKNRQRFNSGFYIKPVYDEVFQRFINNIYNKLEQAERISNAKQLANSISNNSITH